MALATPGHELRTSADSGRKLPIDLKPTVWEVQMMVDLLRGIPLFAGLSDLDRVGIAEKMRTVGIPRGASLIDEGDLSYKFFLILAGTVEVRRGGSSVSTLGPGEFVGEHGILAHERRHADVVALTPVRAAVAIGWDIRELMDRYPSVRQQIMAVDAERSETVLI